MSPIRMIAHVRRRVTGRGYMDVNRISGYIPGKMVFFLMQVFDSACPPHTMDMDQSLNMLPS